MSTRTDRRPPWIIRTYAGFGGAEDTNARFHENLRAGQTGLSVAFDLPTQNGFDPDAPIARGEIGGTGVSLVHLGDMEVLFRDIPLDRINTSMTINATAPFLLGLYIALADEQKIPWTALRGTVQNDLLKEFVARGTNIFTPEVSLRLSTDIIKFTADKVPQWNPINACGYHYMESGARPQEEIGYTFANALMLLDAVRQDLTADLFERVTRRISFFINSGIELVPEICKMRAYASLWPQLCRTEYGISDVRFRAGCQVRSISLPADQPENNIIRIALEALPAILSANARVNALQLPGFREGLSLPDRMEQTLSIRTQQILMHETGIADFPDIFDGNPVIRELTDQMIEQAQAIALNLRSSGYAPAIDLIDQRLTEALVEKKARIDSGEDTVVGVNSFREPVGLSDQLAPAASAGRDAAFAEKRIQSTLAWKRLRDSKKWKAANAALREAVRSSTNIMPSTIEFAKAGGTVGEWTSAIEDETTGRYSHSFSLKTGSGPGTAPEITGGRGRRIVLAKSGLDGHTNGLKVLALALRDAGFEVIYVGTKLEPRSLMKAAVDEDADAVAVSTLSGAHLHIGREMSDYRREHGITRLFIVLGGIIPASDARTLKNDGIDLVVSDSSIPAADIVRQIISLLNG